LSDQHLLQWTRAEQAFLSNRGKALPAMWQLAAPPLVPGRLSSVVYYFTFLSPQEAFHWGTKLGDSRE